MIRVPIIMYIPENRALNVLTQALPKISVGLSLRTASFIWVKLSTYADKMVSYFKLDSACAWSYLTNSLTVCFQ
jgi:hypothetical protein